MTIRVTLAGGVGTSWRFHGITNIDGKPMDPGVPHFRQLMSMTCCYMLKIDGFVKIDGFFHCKPLVKLQVFEFGNSNGMLQCWGSSVQLLYCFESSGQSLKLPWCISYMFVSFKILHQKGVLQHHCDYSGHHSFSADEWHWTPQKNLGNLATILVDYDGLQAPQPGRTCSCNSPWSPKMASENESLHIPSYEYPTTCVA